MAGSGSGELPGHVLSWRPYPWHPVYAGIDPSWEVGLAMGFKRHLQWGPSVIFTFLAARVCRWCLPLLPPYRFAQCPVRTGHRLGAGGAGRFCAASFVELVGCRRGAWAGTINRRQPDGLFRRRRRDGTRVGFGGPGWRGPDPAQVVVLLGALAGFQLMVKTNEGLLTMGLLVVVVVFGQIYWRRATPAAGAPWWRCSFSAGWLQVRA